MQLVDRIEKRRFVGRELLLWLWFESEVFDGTRTTKDHGDVGLWLVRELSLSSGKEVTRIQGAAPALGRDAKEALLAGKLPERASFKVSMGEREAELTIKAETLGLSGVRLPTVLDDGDAPAPGELGSTAPTRARRRRTTVEEDADRERDEAALAFQERMSLAREIESLLEGLYAEFLALRLSPRWGSAVVPAMRTWASGGRVDAARYLRAKGPGARGGRGA